MKIRPPPGSQFWSAWLASGCGTGSLADTLIRAPLLSRESVAAGPSQVFGFLAVIIGVWSSSAISITDDIIPAPRLVPVSLFLATGSFGRRWVAAASKSFLLPIGPSSVLTLAMAACNPASLLWIASSKKPTLECWLGNRYWTWSAQASIDTWAFLCWDEGFEREVALTLPYSGV
jgi:hypothetical protein